MKKAVLISAILIGAFGFGFCKAYSETATGFTENFDSYSEGQDINGAGGVWQSTGTAHPYVSSSTSFSSPNSLVFPSDDTHFYSAYIPVTGNSNFYTVEFYAKRGCDGTYNCNLVFNFCYHDYAQCGSTDEQIGAWLGDSTEISSSTFTKVKMEFLITPLSSTTSTLEISSYYNNVLYSTGTREWYGTSAAGIEFLSGYENGFYYVDSLEVSDTFPCSYYSDQTFMASRGVATSSFNLSLYCLYDPLFLGYWPDQANGRCEWIPGINECRELNSGFVVGQLDEATVLAQTPANCQLNTYQYEAGGYITVPLVGSFWNNTDWNFGPLYANFYDSDNASTSILLVSSLAAQTGQTYSTSVQLSISDHPIYRLEYSATGTDYTNQITLIRPSCCTTVGLAGNTTSTALCNVGTDLYSGCAFAYQNCMASSSNFLEESVCGLQGVFWSLFCPDPAVLNKVQNIAFDMKNRFPITLISSFSDSLSGLSSSSLATSTATSSFFLMDIAPVSSFSSLQAFSFIRNVLIYVFWVLIGVGLVKFSFKYFPLK